MDEQSTSRQHADIRLAARRRLHYLQWLAALLDRFAADVATNDRANSADVFALCEYANAAAAELRLMAGE